MPFDRTLSTLPNTKKLILTGSTVTIDYLDFLVEVLPFNPHVSELEFNNCSVAMDIIAAFVKKLTQVPHIKRLAITNKLAVNDINVLLAALPYNPNVTELILDNNHFNDAGCQALYASIKNLSYLTKLSIRNNNIGAVGFINFLCPMLQDENSNLTSLDLSLNQIDDKTDNTGNSLSKLIACNTKLVELNLSENKLTDRTIELFSEGLKQNHVLRKLYIHSNRFEVRGLEALYEIKQINNSLIVLEFDGESVAEAKKGKFNTLGWPKRKAEYENALKINAPYLFFQKILDWPQEYTTAVKNLDDCVRRDARREFILFLLCISAQQTNWAIPADIAELIMNYCLWDTKNYTHSGGIRHHELDRDIDELCALTRFVFEQRRQIKESLKLASNDNNKEFKIFKMISKSPNNLKSSYTFSLFPPASQILADAEDNNEQSAEGHLYKKHKVAF